MTRDVLRTRITELEERIERIWQRQMAAERDVDNYRDQRHRLEAELHREKQHAARIEAVDQALRGVA